MIVREHWTKEILSVSNRFNNGEPPYNNNPTSNTDAESQKLYWLNGANGDKFGLGITLKVMAGDVVNIWGKSYWHANGTAIDNNHPVSGALLGLLNSMIGSGTGGAGALHNSDVTGAVLNNSPATTDWLNSWLNNNVPTTANTPKAYINWILFDEHIKVINTSSSFRSCAGCAKNQKIAAETLDFTGKFSPLQVFFTCKLTAL